MSPITHYLMGWVLAESCNLDRRDRALVTLAGVAPDVDGLGIIPEFLTRNSTHPLTWGSDYHHTLHNLAFAAIVTTLCASVAHDRRRTVTLAFASFHLHLLADILGSRGPDGYQWPIDYLAPFSHSWTFTWTHQWELNAWPNVAVTAVLLFWSLWAAWSRGHSPFELFSEWLDVNVVAALRGRFGAAHSD